MGLYIFGVMTGLLMCAMVLLIRCAVWFELRHPEDDYWHRGIYKKTETEKGSPFQWAEDLDDRQMQNSLEVKHGEEG